MNRLLLLICAILTIFFSFDSKAQNIDSDKQQESKPDQGGDFTKETPQEFKKIEPKSKVISADDEDSLVIDEAGDDEIKSESDRAGESEVCRIKI